MRYVQYLRLSGACALLVGLALALLALPGVFIHYPAWWAGLLFVPALLLVLGGAASRRGTPLGAPGRWTTDRPLRAALPGRSAVPAPVVRRQLLGETATGVVAGGAWIVLVNAGGLLFFGGGLAVATYGALQLFAAAPRVVSEERRRRTCFRLHRRAALRGVKLTTGVPPQASPRAG